MWKWLKGLWSAPCAHEWHKTKWDGNWIRCLSWNADDVHWKRTCTRCGFEQIRVGTDEDREVRRKELADEMEKRNRERRERLKGVLAHDMRGDPIKKDDLLLFQGRAHVIVDAGQSGLSLIPADGRGYTCTWSAGGGDTVKIPRVKTPAKRRKTHK